MPAKKVIMLPSQNNNNNNIEREGSCIRMAEAAGPPSGISIRLRGRGRGGRGGAIGKTGKSEKGKREEGTRRGGRPGRDSQVKVETPSCQRRRSRGRDGG